MDFISGSNGGMLMPSLGAQYRPALEQMAELDIRTRDAEYGALWPSAIDISTAQLSPAAAIPAIEVQQTIPLNELPPTPRTKVRHEKDGPSDRAITLILSTLLGVTLVGTEASIVKQFERNPSDASDSWHFDLGLTTNTEERLADAAAKVNGQHVNIRCAAINQEEYQKRHGTSKGRTVLGYALTNQRPEHARVRVSEVMCEQAIKLVNLKTIPKDKEEIIKMANGLEVVVHETVHVANKEHNEGRTVCFSFQKAEAVALELGASPKVAEKVVKTMVENPVSKGVPEYNLPAGCHPGEELDLGLSGSRLLPSAQK